VTAPVLSVSSLDEVAGSDAFRRNTVLGLNPRAYLEFCDQGRADAVRWGYSDDEIVVLQVL